MSRSTQNKILTTFVEFSHPGGPFFSPREVRQLSVKAMSLMFPEGRKGRKIIHSLFRVMHPFYWTQSVGFHTLTYMKGVASYMKSGFCFTLDKCLCKRIWSYIEVSEEEDLDDDFFYKNQQNISRTPMPKSEKLE
mmetsp:Transcript_12896/g.12786  ORF Transcript_12896/g.12786 Transcript_12896/m.12786 type:complete len:135 (+) Transcript_12896:928-1332(+)